MKNSVCIFFLCMVSTAMVFSQVNFTPPKSPILNTPEDYASFEPDMVLAAKWLEETPLEKEVDKRKEINFFVLTWVSGSPTVSMTITANLSKYTHKNVDLLGVYMAAYSRHVIENPSSFNVKSATKAGLLSVLACYEISKAKKDKALETLKKDKANIDKYVDEVMAE